MDSRDPPVDGRDVRGGRRIDLLVVTTRQLHDRFVASRVRRHGCMVENHREGLKRLADRGGLTVVSECDEEACNLVGVDDVDRAASEQRHDPLDLDGRDTGSSSRSSGRGSGTASGRRAQSEGRSHRSLPLHLRDPDDTVAVDQHRELIGFGELQRDRSGLGFGRPYIASIVAVGGDKGKAQLLQLASRHADG